MKPLTDAETSALLEPALVPQAPACVTCGEATYPDTWCACDPRLQMVRAPEFQVVTASKAYEEMMAFLDQVERERAEGEMR